MDRLKGKRALITGTNRGEDLKVWPSGCADGCAPKGTPLYLQAVAKAGFAASSGGEAFDEYVSDAAEPAGGYVAPLTWVRWLVATSGSDVDWVVKLIDVYPDEVAGQAEMGGYQLPMAMDIFRGRYRESLAEAKAVAANAPLTYKFALPTTNHVFLPGHKIMVQVQSSRFPLYDRNPQTFVPNIFFAKPGIIRRLRSGSIMRRGS